MLAGCSTVRVPVTVTHPAEIDVSKYSNVSVVNMRSGSAGQKFSSELRKRFLEDKRFTVIDIDRMNALLRNGQALKAAAQDSSDDEISTMIRTSFMINGYLIGNFSDKVESEKTECYKDKKKYSCTKYTRKAEYDLAGDLNIGGGLKGELVRTEKIKKTINRQTSEYDGTPDKISQSTLEDIAISEAVNEFMKKISAWDEKVRVPFVKDKKIPQLETGIQQMQTGNTDEAIKIFNEAAKEAEAMGLEPESIANAFWDLGLAYEYTWQFDKANEAFNNAYMVNSEDRYLEEQNNVNKLRDERDQLKKQNVVSTGEI